MTAGQPASSLAHGRPPAPAAGQQYGYPPFTGPARRPAGVRSLGLAVQILIGLSLAFGVLRLVAEAQQYTLVRRIAARPVSFDQAEADASDQFVLATTLIWDVVVLAAGIVFVVWFFRLRRNAGIWAPQGQRLGQGATVWGWLPVVNFWIPYQVAQDALAAARAPGSADRSGRGLLRFWWVMWVLMVVLAYVNRYLGRELDTVDELDTYLDRLRSYAGQSMLLTVVSLVAAVAAILAVRLLTAAQEARLRASAGPIPPGPSGGW